MKVMENLQLRVMLILNWSYKNVGMNVVDYSKARETKGNLLLEDFIDK